ncbi:hypothetical protein ACSRUE_08960 [Sorangium sp. KYC3313]|uniref:hypothetical protein n=1 Tax=Sorangium sp. KYC3313 TaxID=3449740 RepID=UPI003F8AA760
MSNRRSFHVLAGVPVLGCLLAMPSSARAQHETHVYGVANFGHTGECEDDTSLSHAVHTSTAAAFASTFNLLRMVSLWEQQITTSDSTMTMWNAFHGDSSCGNHVKDYVGDYAISSISNGVGENWIDEAYDDSQFSNDDDCPVSIVFGSSFASRELMYEYGGWRDRKNTGPKTGSTIYLLHRRLRPLERARAARRMNDERRVLPEGFERQETWR